MRCIRMLLCALVLLCLAPQASARTSPPTLPPPQGAFPVGEVSFPLVDPARADPWHPAGGPRTLMTTLRYPAVDGRGEQAEYMHPEVARQSTANWLVDVPPEQVAATRTHGEQAAVPRTDRWPLVVLSPGFSLPRATVSSLAEHLAGSGYAVATVDHLHEAPIALPDGRVVPCARPVPCGLHDLQPVVESRVLDLGFVVDHLSALPFVDGERIGVAGHSIGGASALTLQRRDPRIDAAANLDGTLYRPESVAGLDRPALLLRNGEAWEGDQDPTWGQAWPGIHGWKRWLAVRGTDHSSFTDIWLIIDQLTGQGPPLDPARAIDVTRTFLAAFFDQHLKHEPRPVLDGPSAKFPEVVFVGTG